MNDKHSWIAFFAAVATLLVLISVFGIAAKVMGWDQAAAHRMFTYGVAYLFFYELYKKV